MVTFFIFFHFSEPWPKYVRWLFTLKLALWVKADKHRIKGQEKSKCKTHNEGEGWGALKLSSEWQFRSWLKEKLWSPCGNEIKIEGGWTLSRDSTQQRVRRITRQLQYSISFWHRFFKGGEWNTHSHRGMGLRGGGQSYPPEELEKVKCWNDAQWWHLEIISCFFFEMAVLYCQSFYVWVRFCSEQDHFKGSSCHFRSGKVLLRAGCIATPLLENTLNIHHKDKSKKHKVPSFILQQIASTSFDICWSCNFWVNSNTSNSW